MMWSVIFMLFGMYFDAPCVCIIINVFVMHNNTHTLPYKNDLFLFLTQDGNKTITKHLKSESAFYS